MSTVNTESQRLTFLARVATREAILLEETATRLFTGNTPVTMAHVEAWTADSLMSERMDAFVARFGRLQDTLGDKLIPAMLQFLGERTGPAMDNLDKAERFQWIDSAEDWLIFRKLRNQMVHEYIEDSAILADALDAGRQFVAHMITTAQRLDEEVQRRLEREE